MDTTFDPFAAQREANKAQMLAQIMQGSQFEPPKPNAMAGTQVIPYSPVTGIANMGSQILGAYMQKRALDKQNTLDQVRAQMLADAMKPHLDAQSQQAMIDNQMPGNVADQAGHMVQPTSDDMVQAALKTGDMKFAGPLLAEAIKSRMQNEAKANEPITPYQQAMMKAEQDRFNQTQAESGRRFDLGELDKAQAGVDTAMEQSRNYNLALQGRAEAKRHNLATEAQAAKSEQDQANRPVPAGLGGTFLVRDPNAPSGWAPANLTGGANDIQVDPNSNNLSAQTGLSETAIANATGRLTGRSAGIQMMANKELQDWGIKNGKNIDTLKPQAAAAFNILQQNIQRNNQAGILENELQGSAENLQPILDQAYRGRVNFANVIAAWGGKQVNDPLAVQVADQLARYRQELAGYNAVAGGHLSQNGTPDPHPDDFRAAENVISQGVNSGSVKAIADSVKMSAVKNSKVLQDAIDKANVDYYKLFGAAYHPPKGSAAPQVPANQRVPLAAPGGPQANWGGGKQQDPQAIVDELRRRGVIK